MKKIDLRKYFDAVFVLTLVETPERQEFIKDEFSKLGLEGWEFFYSCKYPHLDCLIDALNSSNQGKFRLPNELGCTLSHYSLIKQALYKGFKNVLIFEDDVCLPKNIELLVDYLESLPENYDVLQFGGFSTQPELTDLLNKHKNDKWIKHYGFPIWNASMYALSQKGMVFWTMFQDKIMCVADMPLFTFSQEGMFSENILQSYMSNIPLHIQQNKDVLQSSIRNEDEGGDPDHIDYSTENLYEKTINRSDYFGYIEKP